MLSIFIAGESFYTNSSKVWLEMRLRSVTDATCLMAGRKWLQKLAHEHEIAVLKAPQEHRHSAVLESPDLVAISSVLMCNLETTHCH